MCRRMWKLERGGKGVSVVAVCVKHTIKNWLFDGLQRKKACHFTAGLFCTHCGAYSVSHNPLTELLK